MSRSSSLHRVRTPAVLVPALAPALAEHLGALAHDAGGGGGGKRGVGAARMPGFTPEQAHAAAVDWLRAAS